MSVPVPSLVFRHRVALRRIAISVAALFGMPLLSVVVANYICLLSGTTMTSRDLQGVAWTGLMIGICGAAVVFMATEAKP